MKQMIKEHYMQAQLLMASNLLNSIKDNIDNTFYEDEDEFEAIIETLAKGTEIALLRMKQIIKDADEDDCDCY